MPNQDLLSLLAASQGRRKRGVGLGNFLAQGRNQNAQQPFMPTQDAEALAMGLSAAKGAGAGGGLNQFGPLQSPEEVKQQFTDTKQQFTDFFKMIMSVMGR